MSSRAATLVVVIVLAAACGQTIAQSADVSGTWSYVAPSLATPTYAGTCQITPTTLTITQVGDSIHGTSSFTNLVCTPTGGTADTIARPPDGLRIVGLVSGTTVTFTIDGTYWSQTAVLTGNTLAGTVNLTYSIPGTATAPTLTGAWTGTRQ